MRKGREKQEPVQRRREEKVRSSSTRSQRKSGPDWVKQDREEFEKIVKSGGLRILSN